MFHDKKIVIAGGTGYIGRAMAARWAADNEVVVLTRNAAGKADNTYGVHYEAGLVQYVHWDARHLGDWVPRLEGCDLLINLAGRSVNCRYTAANRQEIITSRVAATRLLGAALRQLKQPPALWINGASATIYRHADDRAQDEFTGEIEDDFSVQVCKAWEHAFAEAAVPGTRKAVLRMAIVLGKGGALVPYTRLVKCGLGGRHGSGKQMFSWIHETDLCRIVEWLYDHPEQSGVYNAAAPGPVSNSTLMQLLRQQLHRPFGLPSPVWVLKTGAKIIGTETELLLKSRWVVPARLLQQGFIFKYPQLAGALAQIISGDSKIRHA
jgi:uncharacterized protein (TIGR01777 family)